MRPLVICALILVALAGSPGSSSSAVFPADWATCKASSEDVSTQSTLIRANDNRLAAGRWSTHTLRLAIVARTGAWYPDANDAPAIPMQAFGQCGQPLQIPGPLIRVPAHTQVIALVWNAISGRPLVLHGLVDRPARKDREIVIAPNTERIVRFRLNAPGTYFYWGTTTGSTIASRLREDSQLSGAIVVDPEAGAANNDRVFVIGRWVNVKKPDGTPNLNYELNVINGRTWPYTERLAYAKNSIVHWRWINSSAGTHPLHLHGFYFHVDSRGDGLIDTAYNGVHRDMEVTELVFPGATYSMTWKAGRPGSWLFHCHLIYHAIGHVPIEAMLGGKDTIDPVRYDNDMVRKLGMGGLTLGVTVSGKTPVVPAAVQQRISLVVERAADDQPAAPSYRYVVKGNDVPTPLRAANGPPLVLTRGVPVAIDVTNHLDVPTQVHWHGMELTDSYYDGVAGFSGQGARRTPMIMPGDTFEARFTPPRAGTFIYHTHMDDVWQLRAGLAGPLIVLEPGARLDPANDHIILVGTPHAFADRFAVLVNSAAVPPDMTFHVGVKQRLRFINITTIRQRLIVSLSQSGRAVRWKPLALDGAQLPKALQAPQTAVQMLTIGETRDFTFTPREKGTLQMQIITGLPVPQTLTVSVHVI